MQRNLNLLVCESSAADAPTETAHATARGNLCRSCCDPLSHLPRLTLCWLLIPARCHQQQHHFSHPAPPTLQARESLSRACLNLTPTRQLRTIDEAGTITSSTVLVPAVSSAVRIGIPRYFQGSRHDTLLQSALSSFFLARSALCSKHADLSATCLGCISSKSAAPEVRFGQSFCQTWPAPVLTWIRAR